MRADLPMIYVLGCGLYCGPDDGLACSSPVAGGSAEHGVVEGRGGGAEQAKGRK